MANQVAARLAGDDFQHLFSWYCALELLDPRQRYCEARVEDEDAGSFDDVTLKACAGGGNCDKYFQVKFHVDHRSAYSTDTLLAKASEGGTSLLHKFFKTWSKCASAAPARCADFVLFSNWAWDSNDPLSSCISGHDGRLKDEFLDAGPRSEIGKARGRWREELQIDDLALGEFSRSLRLRLGSTDAESLVRQVAERMELRGLRHDEAALKTAAGIVRMWIIDGGRTIRKAELEEEIVRHGLKASETEKAATVYVETIRKRRFDLDPDYLIDWRDHFVGSADSKGHQIKDADLWNSVLLPELYAAERSVNRDTAATLIRARGLSRLSAWFALGYVFSKVAGYHIEVLQGPSGYWRSDAAPSNLQIEASLRKVESSSVLAVGISVTGSLEADVEQYLATQSIAANRLFIRPTAGPGPARLVTANDATALVSRSKEAIRSSVDALRTEQVLLFLFGPLSVACFLGHQLNALGAPVQIMEDLAPGYGPSFLLA